jgi:hypothetical protein
MESYRTEREMQSAIDSAAVGLWAPPGRAQVFVRREVPIAGCIPDVVIIRLWNLPTAVRPHGWSFRHAFVLWLLRRHGTLRFQTLASKMFDAPTLLAKAVADLVRGQLVTQRPSGALQLASCVARLRAEVVAVEAKLRRWREALFQGKTYQRFADRVIVAMDTTSEANVDLSAFKEAGVGLYWFSPSSEPTCAVPAPLRPVSSPEREYLVGSLLVPGRHVWWSRR